MPLKYDPDVIWHKFWNLNDLSHSTIKQFVHDNFDLAGSDLLSWYPSDYNDVGPDFMIDIQDDIMRDWTYDIHSLWQLLGKQISDDVYKHSNRHTLLPLRNKHIIVPGGRFREFYYWDSYWIIRGLLASNMYNTAQIVCENLLDFVDKHGFVPNGSRSYYLNRSQPPFLTQMVDSIYSKTKNNTFLYYALPLLDKEYKYWMNTDTHAVVLKHVNDTDHDNTYILNRYYSNVIYPRPESYLADETTAMWLLLSQHKPIPHYHKNCTLRPLNALSCSQESYLNNKDVQSLMSELTASAETGWDFASRWFHDRANLTTANTLQLIPVCLNTYMAINERILSKLYNMVDNNDQSEYYENQYNQRVIAIDKFLFNETTYQWNDYNYVEQRASSSSVYVSSNYLPLYGKCYNPCKRNETRIIDSLIHSGLIMQGGIVTSLDNDGQQWDYPNAWAPLQHMLIEGLANTQNIVSYNTNDNTCILEPNKVGQELASSIARQWLYSNFISYNSTGYMMEKYYAPAIGAGTGLGGEYVPQKGFGWSNGVALILLEQYGSTLNFTEWFNKHKHSIDKDYYNYHPLHLRYDPEGRVITPINWLQPDVEKAEADAALNIHHHHHYRDPYNLQEQLSLNGLCFESGYVTLSNQSYRFDNQVFLTNKQHQQQHSRKRHIHK